MSLVVYLDLDRTLYRTNLGGRLIWEQIGSVNPRVDWMVEHGRQRDFYVHEGDLYAYDLTAHLRSLGLDEQQVYADLRSSQIADGRLEYDGVSRLVSWIGGRGDVAVLTYGVDDYQKLKASLCPSLENVEVITTLRPKGEYLADKGQVWLVDDKPIGDELPAGVRFIQVHMADKDSRPPASELGKVSTSLQGVLEILQNNI